MRACMHALCCAHSRSSLRCAHGCQELFPSPHTALWRHQHRSHRAVAARTARARTARARAAGRGPSTHTPTTNRTSTPRTQHGHTGVRSAKRTGAGSAVPRPCLRSLAAVGRRHLPTCATWAPCVWRWPGAWPWRNAPRARPATPTPAPESSRPWSHIIHQWTVNAGSSCRRPCWPFHGAGRPHGAACSTAPAPQFTARAHTQRLCSKVRAPDTLVRAQPPPPPAHSPRAASAPHADLVLHARYWRRLSPASRPALERGWLKISTTSANRPLQLSSKKVDFCEGWNDPL